MQWSFINVSQTVFFLDLFTLNKKLVVVGAGETVENLQKAFIGYILNLLSLWKLLIQSGKFELFPQNYPLWK